MRANTVCTPLCLASATYVFAFTFVVAFISDLFLFTTEFHCMNIPYCLSVHHMMDIFIAFQSLTIVNNAAKQTFTVFCVHVFISLGQILKSGIAGLYDEHILKFLKNSQMIFQEQCIKIPVPPQYHVIFFLIIATQVCNSISLQFNLHFPNDEY